MSLITSQEFGGTNTPAKQEWPDHQASYSNILNALGVKNTLNLILSDIFGTRNCHIHYNGQNVAIRGGETDRYLINDIFVNREYDFPQIQRKDVQTIVDAGANTGFASLFLNKEYPGSKIIALEPEESNFGELLKNTNGFENIHALKAGLRNRNTNLVVEDLRGTGKRGFQVKETLHEGGIEAMDIPSLMKRFGLETIDILKIDIEGSEKELFEGDTTWLSKVKYLIIELHDRYKKGCSRAFFNAIFPYEYAFHEKGENILIDFTKST